LTGRFDAADPGVCIDSVFRPGNDSRILAEAILWGHRANVRVSWSRGRRKVAFNSPQARQVHRNSFGTIWTRLGKENFAGRGALSITVVPPEVQQSRYRAWISNSCALIRWQKPRRRWPCGSPCGARWL